jgi:uncharacterized protein YbjT (DUF2867 family)
MRKILVAGASGMLGRLVVAELKRRGYWVRALTRTGAPPHVAETHVDEIVIGDLRSAESLHSACTDIDLVISCAGASMNMRNISDRSTFLDVDYHGNIRLLHAAQKAGVKKFIYVSTADGEKLQRYEYFRAHYLFETDLAASGLEYAVIQPTGFFYIMGEFLTMAKNGKGFLIGDGTSRTNPVHEQDVAEACVDAIDGSEHRVIVGGPEVFTRREIVELAFSVAGRTPSIITVPRGLFLSLVWPMKFINPRIHALLELGAVVSTTDAVVNAHGKRRLREYFQSLL